LGVAKDEYFGRAAHPKNGLSRVQCRMRIELGGTYPRKVNVVEEIEVPALYGEFDNDSTLQGNRSKLQGDSTFDVLKQNVARSLRERGRRVKKIVQQESTEAFRTARTARFFNKEHDRQRDALLA